MLEGVEAGEMLVADPHADEMPKAPHSKIIGSVRRLSSANKPKALSTSIKRKAANGEEFARSACSFVKQNSSLPQQVGSHVVTGCHPLALKVADGPTPFAEPGAKKIPIPRNFFRGKTDNRDRRIVAQ
jgi:hypothetical protein